MAAARPRGGYPCAFKRARPRATRAQARPSSAAASASPHTSELSLSDARSAIATTSSACEAISSGTRMISARVASFRSAMNAA